MDFITPNPAVADGIPGKLNVACDGTPHHPSRDTDNQQRDEPRKWFVKKWK
jgi:hypothetical protein